MKGAPFDATPLLRAYAWRRRRQLAAQRPAETQRRQLLRLVRAAGDTAFGRAHGFDRIRTVGDFQRRVPVRRYEAFWQDYLKPGFPVLSDVCWPGTIPYFALSSGTTTGRTKYVPVSRRMLLSNRDAAFDLLTHHLAARPESRVFGGRSFMLGGSTDLTELAPGVRAGDLSGILAREIPTWARPFTFPPAELALIADWSEKMERLGGLSLDADIRTIGGTVSWLPSLVETLDRLRPGTPSRLVDFYPNLELVAHGGAGLAPYRRRFEALLDGSHAELREVYPASEGFVAIADRGPGEGLRLNLDIGLFFEFVPVAELDAPDPRRFWLADAEPGVDYALVLTTCAGLWAYVLGDTVRLVGRDPPRVLVTGRTSYFLSAFGEHLIGEEIERAVAEAADEVGLGLVEYAVGPVFPERPGERGGHLFVVEFAGGPPAPGRAAAFGEAVDRRLAALNADYEAHRAEGVGMLPPQVVAVPPGAFEAWMRGRGRLGGQNKVPRVVADPEMLASLRALADGL